MVGAATAPRGGGSPPGPPPPFLLLKPTHLRLYGVDSSLNLPSQRPKTAAAEASAATPISAAGAPRTTPAPTTMQAANSNTPAGAARDAPAGGLPSAGRPGVMTSEAPLAWGASHGRLPSAPPAMSARCQIHPSAMQSSGLTPGDPVLVLVRAEGRPQLASRGPTLSAKGAAGSAGSALLSPAESPRVELAGGGEDDREGMGGEALLSGVGARASGVVPQGRLPSTGGGGGSCGGGSGGACAGSDPARHGGGGALGTDASRQHQAERQETEQPVYREEVTCLLCSVWANPTLSPAEAAVDGRVKIPLHVSEYSQAVPRSSSPANAPAQSPARVDTAPRLQGGGAGHEQHGYTPESVVSSFLRAVRERGVAAGRGAESSAATVGVIPLFAVIDGASAGGRGARVGQATPVGGRISARVLRRRIAPPPAVVGGATAPATMPASSSDASGGGSVATTSKCHKTRIVGTTSRPTIATVDERHSPSGARTFNPPATATPAPPPPDSELGNARGPPRDCAPLPPEYTSLVKRSLRHLVVAAGCEVVVPALPNVEMDQPVGVPRRDDGGSVGVGGLGVRRNGGQRPQEGHAVACIDSLSIAGGASGGSEGPSHSYSGGLGGGLGRDSWVSASPLQAPLAGRHAGGKGFEGSGALAALLGGAVCIVAPESQIFVEGGEGKDGPMEPRQRWSPSLESAGSAGGGGVGGVGWKGGGETGWVAWFG